MFKIKSKSIYPIFYGIIFMNLACDERLPEETTNPNATLTLNSLQAVTNDGTSVGEVVSGSSNMRMVFTLNNSDGTPIKNESITFSDNGGGGGDYTNGRSVNTDENGEVVNTFKPNSSEEMVDRTTTPDYEGLTVTATYANTTITAKAQFNVYQEKDDVWPYTLFVSSDVDNIKLDNGATTAEIEARLLNKSNIPLQNVILSFDTDRGFIDSEGETDSTGAVTLTFQDNGVPEDIGPANIVCTFTHEGFDLSISDSVQVIIGTDNGLSMEILPVSFDESNNTVVVGEDIAGDASQTRLIATVTDTAGNPISGQSVEFVATSSNVDVGTINYQSSVSNSDGQVIAHFDDGGNTYKDNPGTPNFEGVTVVAKFGDKITEGERFNIYSEDDVWPYNLFVTTDTDVIALDGGETVANIVTRLLNKLGNPVGNAQINYEATLGFINAIGLTDTVGTDTAIFTDLGNPEDVGVSDISATFSHPGFSSTLIQDSLQVYIEDPSFQTCAFMEIPASIPGDIVVRDGGGLESTFIKAEVYDDNGTLINTPTPVVFTIEPLVGDAYLETPGQTSATIYTVNGVATVSINSGSEPGPVRIVATCDCDQDGSNDLTVIDVPVTIASGQPHRIEAEYDPNSTEAVGGGFYRTECAALVSDIHGNPVEDTTYVYWDIAPLPPDTTIDAVVEGVSFTNNEGVQSGEATVGMARSFIIYSTDAIGDIGKVRATTATGDLDGDGESDFLSSYINEGEGDATLFFLPGAVTLTSNATYHDFSIPFPTDSVDITVTAIVIDYYGNPVVGAPVSFVGTGVSRWVEVGYEVYEDWGLDTLEDSGDILAGENDGCFSWRDYGADDDPETIDWGNYNNIHDAIDTTGDGEWDVSEVSENFDDFGLDGLEGTADQGEGDGEWNGYSMIGCEPIVLTDEDGYASISVRYLKELCNLANTSTDDPPICSYDDFTSSISATLMIPTITTSDPLDILLVRSPVECD